MEPSAIELNLRQHPIGSFAYSLHRPVVQRSLVHQSLASSVSHVWTPLRNSEMKNLVLRFVKDESGATAIEYGLIAAGISVAIILTVQGLGTKLTSTFKAVSDNLI